MRVDSVNLLLVGHDDWRESSLRNLYQLYIYEFGLMQGGGYRPNWSGRFTEFGLDCYFPQSQENRDHWAYIIQADDGLAGFALVRWMDESEVTSAASESYEPGLMIVEMEQFFIHPSYRRRRVGWRAACQVFNLHPNEDWELFIVKGNQAARNFWEDTLQAYRATNRETVYDVEYGNIPGLLERFRSVRGPKP